MKLIDIDKIHWNGGATCPEWISKEQLEEMEEADRVEHAHWEDWSETIGGHYHDVRTCSKCHWTHETRIHFYHCPLCGRKMDEPTTDCSKLF